MKFATQKKMETFDKMTTSRLGIKTWRWIFIWTILAVNLRFPLLTLGQMDPAPRSSSFASPYFREGELRELSEKWKSDKFDETGCIFIERDPHIRDVIEFLLGRFPEIADLPILNLMEIDPSDSSGVDSPSLARYFFREYQNRGHNLLETYIPHIKKLYAPIPHAENETRRNWRGTSSAFESVIGDKILPALPSFFKDIETYPDLEPDTYLHNMMEEEKFVKFLEDVLECKAIVRETEADPTVFMHRRDRRKNWLECYIKKVEKNIFELYFELRPKDGFSGQDVSFVYTLKFKFRGKEILKIEEDFTDTDEDYRDEDLLLINGLDREYDADGKCTDAQRHSYLREKESPNPDKVEKGISWSDIWAVPEKRLFKDHSSYVKITDENGKVKHHFTALGTKYQYKDESDEAKLYLICHEKVFELANKNHLHFYYQETRDPETGKGNAQSGVCLYQTESPEWYKEPSTKDSFSYGQVRDLVDPELLPISKPSGPRFSNCRRHIFGRTGVCGGVGFVGRRVPGEEELKFSRQILQCCGEEHYMRNALSDTAPEIHRALIIPDLLEASVQTELQTEPENTVVRMIDDDSSEASFEEITDESDDELNGASGAESNQMSLRRGLLHPGGILLFGLFALAFVIYSSTFRHSKQRRKLHI